MNEIEDDGGSLMSDTEHVPLRRSTRETKEVIKLNPTFKGQSYAQMADIEVTELPPEAIYACMAQLSLKSGLKHFKNEGVKAIKKELSQLHLRDTFQPIDPKDM